MSDCPQQKTKPKTWGRHHMLFIFSSEWSQQGGAGEQGARKGKVHFTEPLNHLSISDSVIMGLLLKACKHLISRDSVDKRLGFSPLQEKVH